jgi:hypothetical protein
MILLSNQQELLEKYVRGGELRLTPTLNILVNSGKNYYAKLGEYIAKRYKESNKPLPVWAGIYLGDDVGRNSMLNLLNFKERKAYQGLGIHFITAALSPEYLKLILGEPLYHDEFGEGFANDEGLEDINAQYASYFVDLNGLKAHIGFDHRGTQIETEFCDAEELFNALKIEVDLYISKQ